ncbi:hypothetical protein V1521DRAFT_463421 [Lipomyces starkeyi]
MPDIDANIKHRLSGASSTNIRRSLTTRGWYGALRYLDNDAYILMIAVECHVGIAMCVDERKRRNALPIQYYDTIREVNDAIEHAQYEFRAQLPDHPYGPLITKGVSWYGRIKKITLEIFRRENEDCPPDAVLHPNKSYVIVEDAHFVAENVPSNLSEVTMGDCIPTHILSNGQIQGRPANFFQREWFEKPLRASILETAVGADQEEYCCQKCLDACRKVQ